MKASGSSCKPGISGAESTGATPFFDFFKVLSSTDFRIQLSQCGFSLMSSLTVHRSRVHKIGEDGQPLTSNEYECERCGELFGTSVELSVSSVLFSGLDMDFVVCIR